MNEKETSEELQLIANRLRKARKEKGITQLELSLQAGISQNMVACIEAGKRNPTFQTIIKMCRALDVRLSDILKDIEPAARTDDSERRLAIKQDIQLLLNEVFELINEL